MSVICSSIPYSSVEASRRSRRARAPSSSWWTSAGSPTASCTSATATSSEQSQATTPDKTTLWTESLRHADRSPLDSASDVSDRRRRDPRRSWRRRRGSRRVGIRATREMTLVSFPARRRWTSTTPRSPRPGSASRPATSSPALPTPPVGSRILSLRLGVRRRSESARRSVCIDMKLTVQTFLTLDGVMQAPGGPEEDPSDAFTHGGWQAPFPDPAVSGFVTELNSHARAFLFGRRTFDIFRGHWPDQTDPADPIATAINSLPKYVVSNSLSGADATWRGEHPDTARLVTGDVVAALQALKDEPGDELQIWGSSQLLQTLLQHELVDRFRLMTFPLVLGSGRRLFNDGLLPATMRPVDLTVTDLGIVLGTYEPAGPVRHGQM